MADLEALRRVAAAGDYLATVATTRPDGSVHSSLVKAGVLPAPDSGRDSIAMVIMGDARKLDLLRRAGRATVTFTAGGRWVSADGAARVVGPDDPWPPVSDVPALLRDVFAAAGGVHDDWAEYDRVMARERRTAVLVTPERIIGTG